MKRPAPTRRKKPLNLTVSPDVREALERRADAHKTSISNLLSIVAKVYCELPVSAAEKAIEADLKRALGRSQFLAFLDAVKSALPAGAQPAATSRSSSEGAPEAWTLKKCGILAFFAPDEANVGLLFAKASALKGEHALERVLVVTTNSSTVPPAVRADLAAASILVVSLADFPAALRPAQPEASARPLLKRQRKAGSGPQTPPVARPGSPTGRP